MKKGLCRKIKLSTRLFSYYWQMTGMISTKRRVLVKNKCHYQFMCHKKKKPPGITPWRLPFFSYYELCCINPIQPRPSSARAIEIWHTKVAFDIAKDTFNFYRSQTSHLLAVVASKIGIRLRFQLIPAPIDVYASVGIWSFDLFETFFTVRTVVATFAFIYPNQTFEASSATLFFFVLITEISAVTSYIFISGFQVQPILHSRRIAFPFFRGFFVESVV